MYSNKGVNNTWFPHPCDGMFAPTMTTNMQALGAPVFEQAFAICYLRMCMTKLYILGCFVKHLETQ